MAGARNILILGATGSIGLQTLSVISAHPQKFTPFALVAHKSYKISHKLCLQHKPKFAVLTDEQSAEKLKQSLHKAGSKTKVLSGMSAVLELIAQPKVDGVMCAMVGAVGILPVFQALEYNKTIYLANKESMVVAGELINAKLAKSQSVLLPIDSEHNAIFQCLPEHFNKNLSSANSSTIKNIWLTASGGPFHSKFNDKGVKVKRAQLKKVSIDQALAHPKWDMGAKISIDSATLMNKGLEVIEAHFLFNLPPSQIKVVVHPQSIIHSMVEYIDGSFLAQLSAPDMRVPIAHALAFPDRISAPPKLKTMNPFELEKLHFEKPDHESFPCLNLAYKALTMGGNAPLVLNAANEITVQAFIDKKIGFMDIAKYNAKVLNEKFNGKKHKSVESLIKNDFAVREYTKKIINGK